MNRKSESYDEFKYNFIDYDFLIWWRKEWRAVDDRYKKALREENEELGKTDSVSVVTCSELPEDPDAIMDMMTNLAYKYPFTMETEHYWCFLNDYLKSLEKWNKEKPVIIEETTQVIEKNHVNYEVQQVKAMEEEQKQVAESQPDTTTPDNEEQSAPNSFLSRCSRVFNVFWEKLGMKKENPDMMKKDIDLRGISSEKKGDKVISDMHSTKSIPTDTNMSTHPLVINATDDKNDNSHTTKVESAVKEERDNPNELFHDVNVQPDNRQHVLGERKEIQAVVVEEGNEQDKSEPFYHASRTRKKEEDSEEKTEKDSEVLETTGHERDDQMDSVYHEEENKNVEETIGHEEAEPIVEENEQIKNNHVSGEGDMIVNNGEDDKKVNADSNQSEAWEQKVVKEPQEYNQRKIVEKSSEAENVNLKTVKSLEQEMPDTKEEVPVENSKVRDEPVNECKNKEGENGNRIPLGQENVNKALLELPQGSHKQKDGKIQLPLGSEKTNTSKSTKTNTDVTKKPSQVVDRSNVEAAIKNTETQKKDETPLTQSNDKVESRKTPSNVEVEQKTPSIDEVEHKTPSIDEVEHKTPSIDEVEHKTPSIVKKIETPVIKSNDKVESRKTPSTVNTPEINNTPVTPIQNNSTESRKGNSISQNAGNNFRAIFEKWNSMDQGENNYSAKPPTFNTPKNESVSRNDSHIDPPKLVDRVTLSESSRQQKNLPRPSRNDHVSVDETVQQKDDDSSIEIIYGPNTQVPLNDEKKTSFFGQVRNFFKEHLGCITNSFSCCNRRRVENNSYTVTTETSDDKSSFHSNEIRRNQIEKPSNTPYQNQQNRVNIHPAIQVQQLNNPLYRQPIQNNVSTSPAYQHLPNQSYRHQSSKTSSNSPIKNLPNSNNFSSTPSSNSTLQAIPPHFPIFPKLKDNPFIKNDQAKFE